MRTVPCPLLVGIGGKARIHRPVPGNVRQPVDARNLKVRWNTALVIVVHPVYPKLSSTTMQST